MSRFHNPEAVAASRPGAAASERRARVMAAILAAAAYFLELRPIAAAHGYAAGQSTPIFAPDAKLPARLSRSGPTNGSPAPASRGVTPAHGHARSELRVSGRQARGSHPCHVTMQFHHWLVDFHGLDCCP